jgi:PilZ domain
MRVPGLSDERRAAPRYDVAAFVEQMVCRVNPGHEVELVNVSSAGAGVEAAFALLPGRPLQLHAQARGRRAAIEARVVWCRVTAVMAGRVVRYTAGLAFVRRIDLTKELALTEELAAFVREGTVSSGS